VVTQYGKLTAVFLI